MSYLYAKLVNYFSRNPPNKTPYQYIHYTNLLVFTTLFITSFTWFLGLKLHVLMSKIANSFTLCGDAPDASRPPSGGGRIGSFWGVKTTLFRRKEKRWESGLRVSPDLLTVEKTNVESLWCGVSGSVSPSSR